MAQYSSDTSTKTAPPHAAKSQHAERLEAANLLRSSINIIQLSEFLPTLWQSVFVRSSTAK